MTMMTIWVVVLVQIIFDDGDEDGWNDDDAHMEWCLVMIIVSYHRMMLIVRRMTIIRYLRVSCFLLVHCYIFHHIATTFKLGDVDLIYDIQVNCTSMAIQIDLTLQKFPHLDLESFRLRDPSCIPYEKSTNHVILRTRLDACGTTNKHRNESVTYYNSVTARVVQSKSRMYIVEFPFSCTFIKRRTIGTPSFQLRKRVFVVEG